MQACFKTPLTSAAPCWPSANPPAAAAGTADYFLQGRCSCLNCQYSGHEIQISMDACRARAHVGRRHLSEAEVDLTEALAQEPFSTDLLLLRSEVRKESHTFLLQSCHMTYSPRGVYQVFREQGAHERCFLDLQRAASLPAPPADVLPRLQAAAAACLTEAGSHVQVSAQAVVCDNALPAGCAPVDLGSCRVR